MDGPSIDMTYLSRTCVAATVKSGCRDPGIVNHEPIDIHIPGYTLMGRLRMKRLH